MDKDAAVIKKLAELGFDVTPKTISPQLQQVIDRIDSYEKEFSDNLDPKQLTKYLG